MTRPPTGRVPMARTAPTLRVVKKPPFPPTNPPMCTVSFLPTADGFLLTMNRDELHVRPPALPPEFARAGRLRSLYPRERGDGTWIGVNEAGLVFALLNWHARPLRDRRPPRRRGTVITTLLAAEDPAAVETIFGGMDVSAINPFRLVVAAVDGRVLEEWRSDGSGTLEVTPLPWRRAHWFSSGFDEPAANRVRAETCKREAWASPPRTSAWLRDLHRSHHPAKGAFSICMHRDDAETVSCTELTVDRSGARMTYSAGPACTPGPRLSWTLPLRPIPDQRLSTGSGIMEQKEK